MTQITYKTFNKLQQCALNLQNTQILLALGAYKAPSLYHKGQESEYYTFRILGVPFSRFTFNLIVCPHLLLFLNFFFYFQRFFLYQKFNNLIHLLSRYFNIILSKQLYNLQNIVIEHIYPSDTQLLSERITLKLYIIMKLYKL